MRDHLASSASRGPAARGVISPPTLAISPTTPLDAQQLNAMSGVDLEPCVCDLGSPACSAASVTTSESCDLFLVISSASGSVQDVTSSLGRRRARLGRLCKGVHRMSVTSFAVVTACLVFLASLGVGSSFLWAHLFKSSRNSEHLEQLLEKSGAFDRPPGGNGGDNEGVACPEGWVSSVSFSTFPEGLEMTGEHFGCYHFDLVQMGRDEAKVMCENAGGYLAEVGSAEEARFLGLQIEDIRKTYMSVSRTSRRAGTLLSTWWIGLDLIGANDRTMAIDRSIAIDPMERTPSVQDDRQHIWSWVEDDDNSNGITSSSGTVAVEVEDDRKGYQRLPNSGHSRSAATILTKDTAEWVWTHSKIPLSPDVLGWPPERPVRGGCAVLDRSRGWGWRPEQCGTGHFSICEVDPLFSVPKLFYLLWNANKGNKSSAVLIPGHRTLTL